MKHKIIKTDAYLLAVGKDRKRGWFYCVRTKSFFHDEGEDVLCCNGDLAVDSHLPLNGADVIDNLPLLPQLEEDDVDNLAEEWIDQNGHKWSNNNNEVGDNYGSFKSGYNKAKEKYKYTEEDLLRLLCWADSDERNVQGQKFEDFIQSLSQPKIPIGFECETRVFEEEYRKPIRIATTTTPEGHTQWVGTYIYK